MRKRPRSGVRNEASAMPVSRYAFRAWGGSAGTIASAISSPPSGPSGSGTTAPDTRSSGGAPATSSRSLADCSTTRSSQPRSLRGVSVRGRPRRAGVELDDERVEVVGIGHRAVSALGERDRRRREPRGRHRAACAACIRAMRS